MFGQVGSDPGEFDGAPDRPYNASPDAMMVGLGAVRLLFQPDRQARKWVPIIDPPVQGLRIDGEIKWSDAVCPGSPSDATPVMASGRDIVVLLIGRPAVVCGGFTDNHLA